MGTANLLSASWKNGLKSDTSFFCNLSQSHLVDHQMKFIFPQNGSWWQGNWAMLEIDFDDGLGWRNFNNGVFDVYYDDVFSDKQLQFKARFDDHTYYFTALLKSAQCQSVFPAPHLPSWISDNADAPWLVQADTEWGVVTANAYTLNSEDGIFDRPFIFIEGIDFGNDHYENQNGTFRLKGDNIALHRVDSHNFIVDRDTIGDTRFQIEKYDADGYFAIECFGKAKTKSYIPKVLSTYNSLRWYQ